MNNMNQVEAPTVWNAKKVIFALLSVPLTFALYFVFYIVTLPAISLYGNSLGIDMVEENVQALLASHLSYLLLTISLSAGCFFLATYIGTKLVPRNELKMAIFGGVVFTLYCAYKWFFANMFIGFPSWYAFSLTFLVPIPSAYLAARLRAKKGKI